MKRDNTRYKKEVKLNENTQIVKFAPFNMLVNEILFGYERQVSQKGSVDFELGPTISNVGIGISNHYVDPYNPTANRQGRMGVVMAMGYRYYPLDETEALNRFYVSPILKYKVLNTAFVAEGLDTQKGADNRLNFYFNFGYEVWASKTFALDMYAGMGLGTRNRVQYNVWQEYDPDAMEYKSVWHKDTQYGNVYVFNIGLKVGIGSK